MRPYYKDFIKDLEIFQKKSSHISPHLHKYIEFVYVTAGTLELGIGQDLYHMETGDFAVVFPEMIHHYQVFDSRPSRAIHMHAAVSLSGGYVQTLMQRCPVWPVIQKKDVHEDVRYALGSLMKDRDAGMDPVVSQAFVQIILSRCLPFYTLMDRERMGNEDIVYQTVVYIAGHFTEEVTLTGMAKDLGFSPYVLSRVFSGTFHMNFNQYLNEARLDYVCSLLEHTEQSVTEAYENAGFQSQRTFNRVFLERYGMTPREYRKKYQGSGNCLQEQESPSV